MAHLRGFETDLLHELGVLAEFVGDVPGPQHAKNASADALFLLVRERRPSKRPSRIRLQDLPERKLRVLFDELDPESHAGPVAGFDALDDLVHHRVNPMPASFRMLHRGQVTRDDAHLSRMPAVPPENPGATPVTIAVVVNHVHRTTNPRRR